MLQELEAEALPEVGARDDPRDVGHDEGARVRQADHAELRLEGREGIVGDLGAGGGDHGEQRALPRIRLAQEAHVGDQLEHELELALLAVLAGFPLARALVRGRRKPGIAAPAAPAPRDEQRVARGHHLAELCAGRGIAHFGAGRNREVEVHARLPGHVLALAVLAALGAPVRAIAVVEQRREVRVGAHVHAAAGAAVAAVGPAFGDELFAAKAGSSGPARPRHHVNYCSVDEHQCGVRNAECGVEREAHRAVLIDETVIATISPASCRSDERRSASRSLRSSNSPSQNCDSSASSSTMPILAINSLRERARHAAR